MSGNNTYYKNTSRTVSGLLKPIFDNDVILLCDTSLGAVSLILPAIPQDFFSTTYKIYVTDKSNNASVNNITIIAPTGATINNAPSSVINVNNGVAIITISSNKSYNAQFNFGGSGGAIAVLNEGVQITPNVSSIDFLGILVNATAVGNNVSVAINPAPPISVTFAQITTLIGTNALIPSQIYEITDAIYIQSSGGSLPSPTYITTANIYLLALSTNTLASHGSGLFLNPDFNGVGNYSGVTGFVAQNGVYNNLGVYVIGDVVIWNNCHWKNISGNNTSYPSVSSVDWQYLAQNLTNGYVKEICFIDYNISTNSILSRRDKANNYVENNIQNYTILNQEAFLVFQWGNNRAVFSNEIKNESSFEIWNNFDNVEGNIVMNQSKITFGLVRNLGFFRGNTFDNARVTFQANLNRFQSNLMKNVNIVNFAILDSSSRFNNNQIFELETPTITLNFGSDFLRNRIFGNNSIGQLNLVLENTAFEDNIIEKFKSVNITSISGTIRRNSITTFANLIVASNQGGITNNEFSTTAEVTISTYNKGSFTNNIFEQQCNVTIDKIEATAIFSENILERNAILNINTLEGNFIENKLSNRCGVTIDNILGTPTPTRGKFERNEISNGSIISLKSIGINGLFSDNNITNGSQVASSTLTQPDIINSFFGNYFSGSSIDFVGIDTLGIFNLNRINDSTINIIELLQGSFVSNFIQGGSVISIRNILELTGNQGIFQLNKIDRTSIQINYIQPLAEFIANVFDSSGFISGDIFSFVRTNVVTQSSISIKTVISECSNNQLTDSRFTYDQTLAPLTQGVLSNVLVSSTVTFARCNTFSFNNLIKSTYVLESPLGGRFDILNDFIANVWESTIFKLTGGAQNGNVRNTTINGGILDVLTLNAPNDITGICQYGVSTLKIELDLNDPAIYNGILKTLTIPTNYENFFGQYVLQQASGNVIEKIINTPPRFPTTFLLDTTSIGSSVNFDVLANQGGTLVNGICSTVIGGYPQTYTISYQLASDNITVNSQGTTYNFITEYNKYP